MSPDINVECIDCGKAFAVSEDRVQLTKPSDPDVPTMVTIRTGRFIQCQYCGWIHKPSCVLKVV